MQNTIFKRVTDQEGEKYEAFRLSEARRHIFQLIRYLG